MKAERRKVVMTPRIREINIKIATENYRRDLEGLIDLHKRGLANGIRYAVACASTNASHVRLMHLVTDISTIVDASTITYTELTLDQLQMLLSKLSFFYIKK